MSNSATPWIAPCQASLSFTIFPTLLKLMSIESVMLSNHLILCRPFSSCPESFPALRSFPKSQLYQEENPHQKLKWSAPWPSPLRLWEKKFLLSKPHPAYGIGLTKNLVCFFSSDVMEKPKRIFCYGSPSRVMQRHRGLIPKCLHSFRSTKRTLRFHGGRENTKSQNRKFPRLKERLHAS